MRDVRIALGAFALSQLTAVRDKQPQHKRLEDAKFVVCCDSVIRCKPKSNRRCYEQSCFVFLYSLACACPLATAEDYKMCQLWTSTAKKVAADPDSHQRACALKCGGQWFWHRYDEGQAIPEVRCRGNKKIVEALKSL